MKFPFITVNWALPDWSDNDFIRQHCLLYARVEYCTVIGFAGIPRVPSRCGDKDGGNNFNICSIELKWDGKITKIWYDNEMRWDEYE